MKVLIFYFRFGRNFRVNLKWRLPFIPVFLCCWHYLPCWSLVLVTTDLRMSSFVQQMHRNGEIELKIRVVENLPRTICVPPLKTTQESLEKYAPLWGSQVQVRLPLVLVSVVVIIFSLVKDIRLFKFKNLLKVLDKRKIA